MLRFTRTLFKPLDRNSKFYRDTCKKIIKKTPTKQHPPEDIARDISWDYDLQVNPHLYKPPDKKTPHVVSNHWWFIP